MTNFKTYRLSKTHGLLTALLCVHTCWVLTAKMLLRVTAGLRIPATSSLCGHEELEMEDGPAAEGIRQFRKPQEVRAGKGEEGRSGGGQGRCWEV